MKVTFYLDSEKYLNLAPMNTFILYCDWLVQCIFVIIADQISS